MQTQVMTVTPAMAAQWLALNTNNRTVSPQRVTQYANDMLAGEWKVTHQGVAISVDNVIGDGQHRLLAIIKAGVPVQMQVTTGLPTDSIVAIDRGFVRTVAHSINMSIEGTEWINGGTVSACKWAYIRRPALSAATLYTACTEIKDSLLFAKEHMGVNVKRVTRACVVGTVALMHARGADQDTLVEFCSKLLSGVTEGAADTAIVRLRDTLLLCEGTNADTLAELQAKTQRAFQLFESQQPCRRLISPEKLPYARLEYTMVDSSL